MFTKKLKLIAVGSLLVVGSVVGVAAAQGGGDGIRPDRAEMKAKMLQKFDANRDGKLDDNERTVMRAERAERKFSKLDVNNDGVLSKTEFAAQKMGRHGGHHRGGKGGPGPGDKQ